MGDISRNFSRWEFKCNCTDTACTFDTVDIELIDVLEDVRLHFAAKSITINSGCRCLLKNMSVGGSKSSQHMQGRAADFVVERIRPVDVQNYLEAKYPLKYGIGRYSTFTHVDTRTGGRARWGD